MKHLIVGDIHGYHHNLRKFLLAHGAINRKGERINRDELKVYSVGDLIDGEVNRQGDILNLEYAPEWFDAVCIGNHEYAFMGGKEFGGRRKHDRKTLNLLLNLIDDQIYVPAIIAHGHLLTHGGLAEHFGFLSVEDAYEYINIMWNMAPDIKSEVALFDWTGKDDTAYGDPTSGIFYLDWTAKRNFHFPQIVGHSTYYTGPIEKKFENGIKHWNIDIGAKVGHGVGGVVIDEADDSITPIFWGERYLDQSKNKKMYPLQGEKMQVFITESEGKKHFLTQGESGKKFPIVGNTHTGARNGYGISTIPTPKFSQKELPPAKDYVEGDMAEIHLHRFPVESLGDVQAVVLDDPEIMQVYRDSITEGKRNLRLKDVQDDIGWLQ